MMNLKENFLLFIHNSNSYFAKKIRAFLPTSWANILCDYEINDVTANLLQYAHEQDQQNNDSLEADGSEDEIDETMPLDLKQCWNNACPDNKSS